jgi:hypothetical protein
MAIPAAALRLLPSEYIPFGGPQPEDADDDRIKAREFSFRLELWDVSRQTVELVLAVAVSSVVAFAAFNAALSEYPNRYITLRHKNRILTSSAGLFH